MLTKTLMAILAATTLIGCGGDDPKPSAGGGAGGSAGALGDGGEGGTAGAGGSSTCIPSAADPTDPEGVDENCDGADGVVGTDVYIDGTTGSDTSAGKPDAPLRSLEAAIALAQSRGGEVLVANGEYALTEIAVSGDYALHGGYGASFVGHRKRDLTVLVAESPEGVLIQKAGTVVLESMTVRSADGNETLTTSHALRLDTASVRLSDVVVSSGSGVSGIAGVAGEPGDPGKNASGAVGASGLLCDGSVQPSFTNGSKPGSPSSSGGSAGNCPLKLPAAKGKVGILGSPGVNASAIPNLQQGLLHWNAGGDGVDDAQPGYGGAGGGSCDGTTPGAGATGGCPGKPGAGGSSGGGSVGILVLAGSLQLENSVVRTGFAGSGADGGGGGTGGPGGLGAKPSCPYYFPSCSVIVEVCTSSSDPFAKNCALYGAAGGAGGAGAHGGGGVGGWTIGVAGAGGTQIDYDANTTFELGATGKGGEGSGSVRAPDGQKRKVLDLAAP